MTQSSHDTFIDRRDAAHEKAGLATKVLFWYDEEGKGRKARRRTNGVAMTMDGNLVVSRAACSRKDQFVKKQGRLVVESRIMGRAQKFCWSILVDDLEDRAMAAAAAYREMFPDDDLGAKRAYNAGKIFAAFKADIARRADELEGI